MTTSYPTTNRKEFGSGRTEFGGTRSSDRVPRTVWRVASFWNTWINHNRSCYCRIEGQPPGLCAGVVIYKGDEEARYSAQTRCAIALGQLAVSE